MAINILQYLETGKDLRGAVILTYSLNLNFFEQLVAPRLDKIGCSNVLILTDQRGYDDALASESRSLTGVGTRYVCIPLQSSGRGVQHAKLILLVGSSGGRLLVGSGNLSFSGYCRNLELFNCFELDVKEGEPPSPEATYPFVVVWQLLERLRQNNALPSTAEERLDAIREIAFWLPQRVTKQVDFQIWHNLEQSLHARLAGQGPVDELQIVAPFIELNTVGALVRKLKPRRLIIGVDSLAPNVDGESLMAHCQDWGCDLKLRALGGLKALRSLHAKIIIGTGSKGAWCASGSANCTPPAMLKTWSDGGNLELVVWQHSPDPTAFNHIWQEDSIIVSERTPASVCITQPIAPDQENEEAFPVRLRELKYEDGFLIGQYDQCQVLPSFDSSHLELLRLRETILIETDQSGGFIATLDGGIIGVEAARILLQLDGVVVGCSPYHWIDQPAKLARYGRRSYYARVKENLTTFDGAGKLFEELLNFLWERIDPRTIQKDTEEREKDVHRPPCGWQRGKDDDKEVEPPPPPSAFITDEDVSEAIGWRVEGYAPYDRSILSLRDLLSLALLKLTVETELDSIDTGDAGERDEDTDAGREVDREAKRRDILIRLRDYLHRYCRKHAHRLADRGFVSKVRPELLFENHYTLSRVLLEFAEKDQGLIFTDDHLQECVKLILGGLFWPQIIELSGNGAWDALIESGYEAAVIENCWNESGLTPLVAVMISEAWGLVPHWSTLLRDEPASRSYLLARSLIDRIGQRIGPYFWRQLNSERVKAQKLWGFRRVADLFDTKSKHYSFNDVSAQLERLAAYTSPVEEKYEHLFSWWKLRQQYQDRTPRATELLSHIQKQGYITELHLFQSLPPSADILAVEGDSKYCPRCYVGLTGKVLWTIRRGELALCSNCGQVALYWRASRQC